MPFALIEMRDECQRQFWLSKPQEILVASTPLLVQPSFFVKQGRSIVQSLTWSTIISLGGPAGNIVDFLVAERMGRKPAIVAGHAVWVRLVSCICSQQATLPC